MASDIPWQQIFDACPRLKGILCRVADSFLTGKLPALMKEPLAAATHYCHDIRHPGG